MNKTVKGLLEKEIERHIIVFTVDQTIVERNKSTLKKARFVSGKVNR